MKGECYVGSNRRINHPESGEHFMRQVGSDSNFEGWLAFQQKRGGTSLRKGTKKLLGCVTSLGESVSGLCVGKQREKRLNRETVAILWIASNVQPRNFIHPPIHSIKRRCTHHVRVLSWCWGDSSQPWEALGTLQVFE